MNFPEDQSNIKVSYIIDLANASSKKISDVSGEFAFIHDGESRKIQIENPATIVPRGTKFMEKATELYLKSLNEK